MSFIDYIGTRTEGTLHICTCAGAQECSGRVVIMKIRLTSHKCDRQGTPVAGTESISHRITLLMPESVTTEIAPHTAIIGPELTLKSVHGQPGRFLIVDGFKPADGNVHHYEAKCTCTNGVAYIDIYRDRHPELRLELTFP